MPASASEPCMLLPERTHPPTFGRCGSRWVCSSPSTAASTCGTTSGISARPAADGPAARRAAGRRAMLGRDSRWRAAQTVLWQQGRRAGSRLGESAGLVAGVVLSEQASCSSASSRGRRTSATLRPTTAPRRQASPTSVLCATPSRPHPPVDEQGGDDQRGGGVEERRIEDGSRHGHRRAVLLRDAAGGGAAIGRRRRQAGGAGGRHACRGVRKHGRAC